MSMPSYVGMSFRTGVSQESESGASKALCMICTWLLLNSCGEESDILAWLGCV